MKLMISGAVMATAILACLTGNVSAKSLNHFSPATNVASTVDTGKMAKDKMKSDKMKSKMAKKKMAKDTTKKMSKM